MSGERVILHSGLPKGWTARRAKDGIHAEFPGTAVLWDEQYYEVVSAEPMPAGGVRYVLERWREEHTIRVFDLYSAESEARLLADHLAARKQRRSTFGAQCAGVLLGNLPADVQQRIANDLGVSPFAMTVLSTIPSVILAGTCVYLRVGMLLGDDGTAVPFWLFVLALLWFAESLLRFYVAMSQNRGAGSLAGAIVHAIFRPREAVRDARGTFQPPRADVPPDVELQDRLTMRGPLLTLLSVDEQRRLAERYAFDYRQHASFVAWTILIGAVLGIASSVSVLMSTFRFSALASLLVAAALAVEQIVRLQALTRGPAGSMLAMFVRPLARTFLERP